MNTYINYFIHGLRGYCSGFPLDEDLPSAYQGQFSAREWNQALRINYGSDNIVPEAVPLRSVFEFLQTGKTTTNPYDFFPLSLDEQHIFPVDVVGTFDFLISGFQEEWLKLRNLNPEAFGDTMLYLAKKYFSNAGFSSQFPHICLYEHLKTTAAIADCLERSSGRKILLLGAGLDDIQGFCYDIVSSKAAKSLKGRSFFLQMLLDTIAKVIISDNTIDATVGHIVYARGGKIFFLLPDRDEIRGRLDDIKKELNTLVWERYRSSLYMFLKYESFDEGVTDLSMVWRRLHTKIRTDKQQKNLSVLKTSYQDFFEPIEEGFRTGNSDTGKEFCRVTGELIINANNELHNIESDTEKPPIWVQSSVKFQSELGEALRDAKEYIQWRAKATFSIKGETPIFTGSTTWLSVPENGGWSSRLTQPLGSNFDQNFRLKLNDLEFLPESPEKMGYGFVFYGGNEQAKHNENNRVKFFSELAGNDDSEDTESGFVRLGVGRMDVDGMGKMATDTESCFALNASFSSRIDLFLSGYVNSIRANHHEYPDYLNIVFSGGDDLLLIGRWDLTFDFLGTLRKDFRRFQGGDYLTMSAGLVLVTPKFPIAKAVGMAGSAEDEAKSFNLANSDTGFQPYPNLPAKNAICLIGEIISWENEYDFVVYFSDKLIEWLNDEDTGISMALINKIYRFHEMQQTGRPDWRWLSAWYFQQCEKNKEDSRLIFSCMKYFLVTGEWDIQKLDDQVPKYRFLPNRALLLLSMGAKIAEFKYRGKKIQN